MESPDVHFTSIKMLILFINNPIYPNSDNLVDGYMRVRLLSKCRIQELIPNPTNQIQAYDVHPQICLVKILVKIKLKLSNLAAVQSVPFACTPTSSLRYQSVRMADYYLIRTFAPDQKRLAFIP